MIGEHYIKNSFVKKGRAHVNSFRLPSEAEWEYAAQWRIYNLLHILGEDLMLKTTEVVSWRTLSLLRGDYAADQALYTVEADAYQPNDYNLYNMAGNVSEWTQSSYDANSYEYMSTMNPSVNDKANMRKVIRGGSWKDVAYSYRLVHVIMSTLIQHEALS